jgi:hypothetical protein
MTMLTEQTKDTLERACSTAGQVFLSLIVTANVADLDMDAMTYIITTALAAGLSVLKGQAAARMGFGDDTAGLVTLKRDPKTGRFMSAKKGKK